MVVFLFLIIKIIEEMIYMARIDEKIRVEREDGRFVEGRRWLNLGQRRRFKSLRLDDEIVLGKNKETRLKMNQSEQTDEVLWLANKLITDWSAGEDINFHTIKENYELADLIEEFVEEVIEINNLKPEKEDEEEKN